MKMYIPQLRDRVKLTADWTFSLYDEGRNYSMYDQAFKQKAEAHADTMYRQRQNGEITWEEWRERRTYNEPLTLPAGTILSIDRIYIKNGGEEYNSVTFRIVDAKNKGLRFWAKLHDVNTMEFEPVTK